MAFSVDPRPSVDCSLGASVETGGEGLFTAADLDHEFLDARNPYIYAETGQQNTEDGLDGEVGVSVIHFSLIQPLSRQLLSTPPLAPI